MIFTKEIDVYLVFAERLWNGVDFELRPSKLKSLLGSILWIKCRDGQDCRRTNLMMFATTRAYSWKSSNMLFAINISFCSLTVQKPVHFHKRIPRRPLRYKKASIVRRKIARAAKTSAFTSYSIDTLVAVPRKTAFKSNPPQDIYQNICIQIRKEFRSR